MKKIIIRSMLMCGMVFLCIVCWVHISRQKYFFQEKENYQVISGMEGFVYSDLASGLESREFIEGCYFIENDRQLEGIVQRTATVTVVGENIDSDILFPSFNRLAHDDISGCLLDAETLYGLFGTTDTLGQTVTYDDREYVVRGVLDVNVPLMVISSKFEDDQRIDGLILNTADEWYRDQYADLLNSVYGSMDQTYYLTDYVSGAKWIETPSKWSDFEFWGSYSEELKMRLEHIFFDNKDITEQVCLRKSFQMMGLRTVLVFLAAVLIVGLFRFLKQLNKK
ncbi:MAG: ABC transporter permease [Lachnospiraceae bacterium]|nr:ABC transporter permease [Lachnospiraceae bacterium]